METVVTEFASKLAEIIYRGEKYAKSLEAADGKNYDTTLDVSTVAEENEKVKQIITRILMSSNILLHENHIVPNKLLVNERIYKLLAQYAHYMYTANHDEDTEEHFMENETGIYTVGTLAGLTCQVSRGLLEDACIVYITRKDKDELIHNSTHYYKFNIKF